MAIKTTKTKDGREIAVPSVHMNGTSRDSLREDLMKAYEAVREARSAMTQTTPNGRDYYVQGNGALTRALDEYTARQVAIGKVYQDLEAIIISLDEEG